MDGLSDREVVDRIRGGSEEAFSTIHRRYGSGLAKYVRSVATGSSGVDADDVMQSFWIRVWSELPKTEKEIELKPWLYRVAHNTAIDCLRASPQTNWVQISEDYDGVPQPPEVHERSRQLRELINRITGLPERQRQAISMFEMEGLTQSQIAERLSTDETSARQLIYRARQTVRRAGALALAPFYVFARKARAALRSVSSKSGGALKIGGTIKAGTFFGMLKICLGFLVLGSGTVMATSTLVKRVDGYGSATAAATGKPGSPSRGLALGLEPQSLESWLGPAVLDPGNDSSPGAASGPGAIPSETPIEGDNSPAGMPWGTDSPTSSNQDPSSGDSNSGGKESSPGEENDPADPEEADPEEDDPPDSSEPDPADDGSGNDQNGGSDVVAAPPSLVSPPDNVYSSPPYVVNPPDDSSNYLDPQPPDDGSSSGDKSSDGDNSGSGDSPVEDPGDGGSKSGDTPGDDPGSDPGDDPGDGGSAGSGSGNGSDRGSDGDNGTDDPGDDPGSDPGSDPGGGGDEDSDPGDDPGSNPGNGDDDGNNSAGSGSGNAGSGTGDDCDGHGNEDGKGHEKGKGKGHEKDCNGEGSEPGDGEDGGSDAGSGANDSGNGDKNGGEDKKSGKGSGKDDGKGKKKK